MFFCYVREVEVIAFESFFLSKLTEGEIKLSEAGVRGGAVLLSIRSHALQSGIQSFLPSDYCMLSARTCFD